MDGRSILLTIDSRLDHTALAGLAVRGLAEGFGLDEAEAYLMELAVVEALSNVIRHAYAGRAGHPVELVLTVGEAGLAMELRDRGRAMGPRALDLAGEIAEPRNIAELPEGGLGLAIIKQVMDEVSYASRDGVNVLRMAKALKLTPPREPASRA